MGGARISAFPFGAAQADLVRHISTGRHDP
jgi:hypothetical protein